MTKSGNRISVTGTILLFVLMLIPILKGNSENNDIKEIYLEGEFGKIIEKYNESGPDKWGIEIQLIYIESLIRDGESERAGNLIRKAISAGGMSPGLRILEGMKALAEGDLIAAEDIAVSVDEKNRGVGTLLQLKFYIELYKRNFIKAESILSELHSHESGFGESRLFFLMSAEYYRVAKEFGKLSHLYKERMKGLSKRKNRDYYMNLKHNYKLYKTKTDQVFWADSDSDKIVIPFEKNGKGALKSISLKKGEEEFSILLDTGNTSGWLIHSRDLRENLKSVNGGRIVMQVGTESGNLDGFNIFSRILEFENFSIKGMFGNYIPKPRSDFFDANLNPAMIRNRIVTLDFINDCLVLRTKERFDSDMVKNEKMEIMKIPWYGYKYPMVPVISNSRNSLAIIETGAENISVRSDFAVQLGISMTPRSKYLSNGEVFQYSLGAINVQLGKYIFVRNDAEIWPLLRFRNNMTGFAPHIIIGPVALSGKFCCPLYRKIKFWCLNMNEKTERSLTDQLKKKISHVKKITKLAGDASERKYYRIVTGNGTLVAMVYPDGNAAEIESVEIY